MNWLFRAYTEEIMPPPFNRHALLNFVRRAAEAAPIPQSVAATRTMDNPLMQSLPDLTRRASAATTTCASNSNASGCEKPTSDSSNTTMPIIVGIVYVYYAQMSRGSVLIPFTVFHSPSH